MSTAQSSGWSRMLTAVASSVEVIALKGDWLLRLDSNLPAFASQPLNSAREAKLRRGLAVARA